MQVSNHFDADLISSTNENSSAPAKRVEISERSLQTSHEPAVESRHDDEATFVSSAVLSEDE
jgi:hypothetical protein